jgi:hypothetical protein
MKKDGKVYYTGTVPQGYNMKNDWEDDEFKDMAENLILEDCTNHYEGEFCGRRYNNVKDFADVLGATIYPYQSNRKRQNRNNFRAGDLNAYQSNRNNIRYNDLARALVYDGKRKSSKRRSKRRSSKRRKSKRRKSSNQ